MVDSVWCTSRASPHSGVPGRRGGRRASGQGQVSAWEHAANSRRQGLLLQLLHRAARGLGLGAHGCGFCQLYYVFTKGRI
ncbi:hypothetical protein E2C01_073982 [Portunus trituberculatus]|uniref:Uncharacterized protein n=1 Tax=Portunus trituberculatus TaxID=210409 RepID=A0A5B7IFJ2_PORTR|nr:hypothetical protein [Portunus trituberculatus]